MSNLIRDGYQSYPMGIDQADKVPRKTEPVKLTAPEVPKVSRASWDKTPVDLQTKSK